MWKIRNLVAAAAASVLVAGSIVPAAASDTKSPVIDPSRTASLTLCKLKENAGNVYTGNGKRDTSVSAEGMPGIRFGALKIADIENIAGDHTCGTYFTNLDSGFARLCAENSAVPVPQTIGGRTCYTTEAMVEALNRLNCIAGEEPGEVKVNRFVASHSATNHMNPTGADGSTVNNRLPLGLYLVAETDYSAYTGSVAGDTAPELISNPSSPFLISLPMSAGDDGDHDYWMYDVTAYPKNQTIHVPKYIVSEADGKTLETVSDYEIGETVHEVIAPDVPAVLHLISDTAENRKYEEYVVADEMDAGLSLAAVTQVKLGAGTVSPATTDAFASFETLSLNRDYRVLLGMSGETGVTAANVKGAKAFRVELLESGLAKLNAFRGRGQLAVFFDAVVTKDAKDGTGESNGNTPSLTFKHANTARATIRGNRPEVYSYRLHVKKKGVTDPTKATFSIRRGNADLSFVEEAAGTWHLLDNDLDAAGSAVTRIHPSGSGDLVIRGLDADIYEITERATESGHELMKSVFKVTLAGNTPVDGTLKQAVLKTDGAETALTIERGTAGLAVENRKSLVLRTGGSGIRAFLFAGAVLLFAAVMLLRQGTGRQKK